MKLGTNDIGSVYLGTNAVQKVYLGTNEVWSSYAYLLDDYPNAAAAYSLRKLRSTYTGSAIRVRRASDNTEQDIGFVNNELDTSTLTTFCSCTNGFVKTWYDQSGNGNNATQTTAIEQPQIVNSGSVILENGKPALQFNGSNYMIFTRLTDLQMAMGVANKTGSSLQMTLTRDGNTNDSRAWLMRENPLTWNMQQIGPYPRTTSYLITTNNQYLMSISANGTNAQYSLNGNLDSAVSETNKIIVSEIGRYHISSLNFKGNVQELVFWNSDNSSNVSAINTIINDFYSIY